MKTSAKSVKRVFIIIVCYLFAALTVISGMWFWPMDQTVAIGDYDIRFHRQSAQPASVLVVGDSFAVNYAADYGVKAIAGNGASLSNIYKRVATQKRPHHFDTVLIIGGPANIGIHEISIDETEKQLIELSMLCADRFTPTRLVCYSPREMLALCKVPKYRTDDGHINMLGYEALMRTEPLFILSPPIEQPLG